MHDTRTLFKQLFGIVTPIAFQYLMSSLVTASDAIMLSFLDQSALAASSLAGQIAFVFYLFYGSFITGLTVLAAQYWGKGDVRTAENVLAMVMRYDGLYARDGARPAADHAPVHGRHRPHRDGR